MGIDRCHLEENLEFWAMKREKLGGFKMFYFFRNLILMVEKDDLGNKKREKGTIWCCFFRFRVLF